MIIQGTRIRNTKVVAADYISEGLILYLNSRNSRSWPGSGTTWYDLSGNGKNATFYSNPSRQDTGQYANEGTPVDGSTLLHNGDIYFDGTAGTGQYYYAGGPNLSTNLTTWTINIWFKVNSFVSTSELPAIFTGIFTGYQVPKGSSVNFTLAFYDGVTTNDNQVHGGFYDGHNGTGGWHQTAGAAVTAGTWYNGTVTYDQNTINLYINGNLVQSLASGPSTNIISDVGYRVARRWDGWDSFDGYVPVVMAYNRALTPAEVEFNYNAFKNQIGNLYRYYKFQLSAVKNDAYANGCWQISEFQLLNKGQVVSMAGASASSPGATYNVYGEGPERAIDTYLTSKFCCQSGVAYPLIIDMGQAVAADSYTWGTANDVSARDPASWTVQVSNDGTNWITLSTVSGFTATESRDTYVGTIWTL